MALICRRVERRDELRGFVRLGADMSSGGDDFQFDRAQLHTHCGRNRSGSRLTGSRVEGRDGRCGFVRQETDISSGTDDRRLDQAPFHGNAIASVEAVARGPRGNRATLHGLIERHRASRRVSRLMRHGSDGTQILGPTQEALILDVIEYDYLTPGRPPLQGVVRKI